MKFTWKYEQPVKQMLKYFLYEQGVSRKLLSRIKFQGGYIEVNGNEENVLYQLTLGDQLTIEIPKETTNELVQLDFAPLDIIYEDEHIMVINKPANVPSIPVQYHQNGTIVNRLKNYYQKQEYENQQIHIVTRLDKDTSGLMLVAKHSFAHSLLDQQLRQRQIKKQYCALVSGKTNNLNGHGLIEAPIARKSGSIMERMVSETGKSAQTEYWLMQRNNQFALVHIRLHTGRTHQIRVHFSSIGCPLLGDDLYGGNIHCGIQRQALHCMELQFLHPITKQKLDFVQPLPSDMLQLIG